MTFIPLTISKSVALGLEFPMMAKTVPIYEWVTTQKLNIIKTELHK